MYKMYWLLLIIFLVSCEYGGIEKKTYFSNGQIQSIVTYMDNVLEGEAFFYYPNGQLKIITHYENGLKVGDFISFYDNGDTLEYLKFNKGKLKGVSKKFRIGNKLDKLQYYSDGRRIGDWKYFNHSGSIILIEKYVNDKLVDIEIPRKRISQ